MPFIVSYNVKLGGVTRDNFIVEKKNLSTASMRIGFGDSANGCRESKKGLIRIVNGGKIILKGTVIKLHINDMKKQTISEVLSL